MVLGLFKNFGRVPPGFNYKVHGPLDPSVYYGKKDTPFGEVKVGEIGSWLARRNKSPTAVIGAVSRAWWRWQFRFCQPLKAGIVGHTQLVLGIVALFYVINYEHLRYHKMYKYHW